MDWKRDEIGWEAEVDSTTVGRITYTPSYDHYWWSIGPKKAWTKRTKQGKAASLEEAQATVATVVSGVEMSKATKDERGDRCKSFEMAEAGRKAMPGLPVMARLDGRAFHTFTKGLGRPYDSGMSQAMIDTASALVGEFHAHVAYTQSDEITLAWYIPPDRAHSTQLPFDGRFQKLTSVLAGFASATFAKLLPKYLPTKVDQTPVFDCRVWQVPSLEDAVEVFLWREADAVKNSITMAASAYYSHRQLQGVNSAKKHDLLRAKGVNWNDYPVHFRRGVYAQRQTVEVEFAEEERLAIPEKFRPAPGTKVKRSRVSILDIPPLSKVPDQQAVLFPASASTE